MAFDGVPLTSGCWAAAGLWKDYKPNVAGDAIGIGRPRGALGPGRLHSEKQEAILTPPTQGRGVLESNTRLFLPTGVFASMVERR